MITFIPADRSGIYVAKDSNPSVSSGSIMSVTVCHRFDDYALNPSDLLLLMYITVLFHTFSVALI